MAEIPNPIVWDFWKQSSAADGVGGTVHYYDTAAQLIYLIGGIKTRTGTIEQGAWETNVWGLPVQEIDSTPYRILSLDHPSNGTLYGVASDGTTLYFLRYLYSMEIGNIVQNGTWTSTNENEIEQCNLTVQNIKNTIFEKDYSLFQPGARLVIKARFGDSEPYDIGVAHVDEVAHDSRAETVPVSGRNKTGYFLKDTALGAEKGIEGTYSGVIGTLLGYAGITDYAVEENLTECILTFEKADQSILSSLQDVCDVIDYKIRELPSGKVVVGSAKWINENFQATGYYQFDHGRDVFKRKTRRVADAAYSQLYVTGKDDADNDLLPVVLDIPNYKSWNIPKKKIFFADAPDGLSQSELITFAESLRDALQYTGIVEQYDSPFRPQLLIGDVAQVYGSGDTEAESLGSITSIRHTFGARGFSTTFTVDSGGTSVDSGGTSDSGTAVTVITKTKNVGGYASAPKLANFIINAVSKHKVL